MTTNKEITPKQKIEERKVLALEKIAESLDCLTMWFEEINKEEWDKRIQFYLYEWLKINTASSSENKENEEEVKE